MSLVEIEVVRNTNPVDMVEHVASDNQWDFERTDDEISMSVSGVWTDYDISMSWLENLEALHLACSFDLKIPENRMQEASNLIAKINEQMLIGHFDAWLKDGVVMFRQSLMLNGGATPTTQQLNFLLDSGLQACERYFQAFQYVAWAGKNVQEALDAVLFETVGNA